MILGCKAAMRAGQLCRNPAPIAKGVLMSTPVR